MDEYVWVFHGDNADFCSAVFSDKEKAKTWINKYSLNGILTQMPINKDIYNWAIESGFFSPSREYQKTEVFIQKFTSAYLNHHHFVDGVEQA